MDIKSIYYIINYILVFLSCIFIIATIIRGHNISFIQLILIFSELILQIIMGMLLFIITYRRTIFFTITYIIIEICSSFIAFIIAFFLLIEVDIYNFITNLSFTLCLTSSFSYFLMHLTFLFNYKKIEYILL